MTTPASLEARFRALMVARTPEERLRMTARMFAGARALVRAGLEGRVDDETELRHLTFDRFYRRDFDEAERQRILTHLATNRAPREP